jgi:hypothetical protein
MSLPVHLTGIAWDHSRAYPPLGKVVAAHVIALPHEDLAALLPKYANELFAFQNGN